MAAMEVGNDVQEQCVELLNEAALLTDDVKKVANLKKVQELIIHQDPALLDNFLDEVVAFQSDTNAEVRRAVLGFIEEACRKDHEMVPKVVANLSLLLQDSFSVAVVKRTIQAIGNIYKITLQWLSQARSVTDLMDSAWSMLGQMKRQIISYVDHDNDGVRTMAVKFMEMVVLLQTYSEPGSLKRQEFCLDGVPMTLKIARPRKLEEEARTVFAEMIKFHGSPHISSVNLMACMGSLTLIARCRPSFIGQVISALESLHANLPPTLSKSQVNSVRKHMKMQLLNLLKHPASYDSHRNICTLLTDLGASQSEVARAMPPVEELRKRQRRTEEPPGAADDDTPGTKRQKFVPEDDDDDDEEVPAGRVASGARLAPVDKMKHKLNAIDITETWAAERLTPQLAADLVLVSMQHLPDAPPALFSNTFTPISAAGTRSQIQHVARLLAAQLTKAGLGPGVEATRNQGIQMTDHDWEMEDEEEAPAGSRRPIATVLSGTVTGREAKKKVALLPSGQMHKKHMAKPLRLTEITRPLPKDELEKSMTAALDRLLAAEKPARVGGLFSVRAKLLAMMSAHFTPQLLDKMLVHILEDMRGRADLVFSWLYEEYCNSVGFSNFGQVMRSTANYEQIFCMLISALMVRPDFKDGEILLTRLFLEAPVVPASAVDILKGFSSDPATYQLGLQLFGQLLSGRPGRQASYVPALLQLATGAAQEIRDRALELVLQLHQSSATLATLVEQHAVERLKWLGEETPPAQLVTDQQSAVPEGVTREWTDELAKLCLHLYLALLPRRESLIHQLAHVYVLTTADVKRTILRVLEAPIRGMGMESPELLTLVETCPKGAETLITRVIHILTDKMELVDRVRDLYQKRVSDVRFLIPVLNGLNKSEVIAALPKLIRLNPVVVKEVFNRLLGIHADTGNFSSPLTPVELLVALHNIDPAKCDMKTIIKATSLCFAEKQVYTQEVLAVVLQQLMEQDPLPVLLMRTVIQSLALYNRLIGLVMNILTRLASRQVGERREVRRVFGPRRRSGRVSSSAASAPSRAATRCCCSCPVDPLREVFDTAPELRAQLRDYVNGFTASQREHLPADVFELITGRKPGEEPVSDCSGCRRRRRRSRPPSRRRDCPRARNRKRSKRHPPSSGAADAPMKAIDY
ncbi:Symplekin [Amphibalanus amphitrite]|uniref:Symplekin n=1 Tax=Amphibalanus amphitrite TaxID=1232801 RepID=A0A6A4VDQ3_AMPAM|nr:Symplekin [Amphibalanus amphitrite]KAF0289381.1 Symplekin [Amphibalanus amphitrite]